MKDLKNILETLTSKPLKKVEEKNYRVSGFSVSKHSDAIKINKSGKMFVFVETEKKEFAFSGESHTKSLMLKLHVAEVDMYDRKSTIFAQHVWVGYQCKYVPGLGRGYLIDHTFQGVVPDDWKPTKAEEDPIFQDVLNYEENFQKYSGGGTAAYGWEGIDD